MNILLTSCGLETETIENKFKNMLPKAPEKIKAMFIPTAANSPDAIEVLPKCLNDLLKCGILRENIVVNDLHDAGEGEMQNVFDVVYLCGGDPYYLLKRINECGFNRELMDYIDHGGIVVGVSAGSIIFANNMLDNLGILQCSLDVHCSEEICERPGYYEKNRMQGIKLGNRQAIILDGDGLVIIE